MPKELLTAGKTTQERLMGRTPSLSWSSVSRGRGQKRAANHPIPAESKDAKVDGGVVVGLGSKGGTNNFCNGDLIRSFS